VSEPLDFQILQALLAKLQGIRKADGFRLDVKLTSVTALPTEVLLVPPSELPFFYLVFPDVGGRRQFFPASQIRDVLAGMIVARADVASVTDPLAKARLAAHLSADIERALVGPTDRAGALGGLVVDTRLQPADPLYGLGADPVVIVRQAFAVTRHRGYGQP
jgi:hypothetical protein